MALAAPKVELQIGGTWTDISQWVYYRDLITIQRGRPNEASALNPSTCAFTLDNRDGRFSPRNPLGPYFGKIGRNIPCRVSVVRDGVQRYRFYGEISSWPVAWDTAGTDVYVQADAAGLTRRLGQGTSPLRSPLFRELTNPGRSGIVAYWPLEEPSGATSCTSGLGGRAMTFSGAPTLAGDSSWLGSDPIAVMGTGVFTGTVPTYTVTGKTSARVYGTFPLGAITGTMPLFQLVTDGTARRFQVKIGVSGTISLIVYSADGDVINDFAMVAFGADGGIHSVILELTQSGADIAVTMHVEHFSGRTNIAQVIPVGSIGFTVVGQTVGMVKRVELNPSGTLGTVAMGHVTVATDLNAFGGTGDAASGWTGESPGNRITRLCQEQKVPFELRTLGKTGNETTMGPQLSSAFLDLVSECVTTDLGMLIESRDALGLAYRTRISQYNQAASLALDYAASQLADPLSPIDDDQSIANDITVSRIGGSSATAEQTTGPLSTMDPPAGVGRYENSVSVSLGGDEQLPNQAGWRLALGTVDETRYPTLSVDLASDSFTASPSLTAAALVTDMGDRLTVAGLPAWLPPGGISQIVQGAREVLGLYEHTIDFNCSPEAPYHAAFTDSSSYGWVDTDGSSLAGALGTTDTAISVSTNSAASAIWTADPTDTPFDLAVGGEVMTVNTVGSVLNGNPFFISNVTGWTAGGNTIARSIAQVHPNGVASALVTPDGTTAAGGITQTTRSAVGTVNAGDSYTAMAWVYSPGGHADLRTCVDFYDINNVYLSTAGLTITSAVPAGVWTLLTQTLVAPASASRAAMRVRHAGTPPASAVYYVWAPRLVPVSSYDTSPVALNSNPGFEVDTAGWGVTNATITRSTVQAKFGSASGLLTTTAATNPGAESSQVAVTAGFQYRARGWLYAPAALPSTARVNLNWFDATRAYLSTSSNAQTLAVGVWQLYDATSTAPANAAYASVSFGANGTLTAGTLLYGDDVKIAPAARTQVMTVDRSKNGVVKAQPAGADVRLANPAIVSL